MAKMKYSKQLQHPQWKKLRSQLLELNNNTCEECGSTDPPLNAHHIRYKKGAMAWEYHLLDLRCLCHTCHLKSHVYDSEIWSKCLDLKIKSKREVLTFIEELDTFMEEKESQWVQYCKDNSRSDFWAKMAKILSDDE